MKQIPIVERLEAFERASPDFIGVPDGGCHTVYHRNPDGPEAAAIIKELMEALQSIKRHCEPQPSPLAKAIVATCDAALSRAVQP